MRRFYLAMLSALLIGASCSKEESAIDEITTEPVRIEVSFEANPTRIELNEEQKTVWTEGDKLSLYVGSAWEKWSYTGATGERSGYIEQPAGSAISDKSPVVAAIYPYLDGGYGSIDGTSVSNAPLNNATQSYHKDSYGLGSNLMAALPDASGVLNFKSLCGWIMLKVTGNGEAIDRVVLRGNNNEVLSDNVAIELTDMSYTPCGNNAKSEIVLNCSGVTLGEQVTNFYISLLPQSLTQGFTVELHSGDKMQSVSTSKSIVIERNAIQPMAAFTFTPDEAEEEDNSIVMPPTNEIWYATTDGQPITFGVATPFDAEIVEHEFGACYNGTCYSLYYVRFASEVTEVKAQAFLKSSNLKTLYLPHSVTTIGSSAMLGCDNLDSVYIGSGITNISMGAFTNCVKLNKLYIMATTPPTLGDYALLQQGISGYIYVGCAILVPQSALDAYKENSYWGKYAEYIAAYDATGGNGGGNSGGEAKPFNHRILLVEHTAADCGYCPTMADRLHALAASEYASYYNEVTCHGGSLARPYSDPAYSEAAHTVDMFYMPQGYPSVYVNFSFDYISNSNSSSNDDFVNNTMNAIFKQYRKNNGSDVGIALSTLTNDGKLEIDVEITSIVEQKYMLAVWVLENGIYNEGQNNAVTDVHKTYNHALRYIATPYSMDDISGDNLGLISAGGTASKSYSVTLDSSWRANQLEVIAIVSTMSDGEYYDVANCAVCPANASKDYEYVE